ncbi:discoidin domain-containing protein [Lactococcus insecticola]|nr:discoidin domain-containing protein [Lactococcus insecticola]
MRRTEKYVVAFRTHVWSEAIEKIFESLVETIDQTHWEIVILADETKARLKTPENFEKVSHTSDLSLFGLPDIPRGQSLWRNGDYAMQPLQHAIVAPVYIILENDTLVRGPEIFSQITHFFDQGGQVVTSKFYPVKKNHWNARTAQGDVLSQPYAQAHVWLWGATQQIADLLLSERKDMLERSDGSDHQWPVDEIFLGSMILKHDLKMLDINTLETVDTSRLDYRPAYSLLDPAIWQGNQLVHPAVTQASIFSKYAAEFGWFLKADSWQFGYGTQVFRSMMLSHLDNSNASVYNAIIRNIYVDHLDAMAFSELARQHGLTYDGQLDPKNLALHKPALSSTSFSYKDDNFSFAEAAVDGNLDVDKYRFGGFASRWEEKPWWQVDLLEMTDISEIKLYHREGFFERTVNLGIAISSDGDSFVTIAELHDIDFEKIPTRRNQSGYAFVKSVAIGPVRTRFVRLTNLADEVVIFNLNQVEIF